MGLQVIDLRILPLLHDGQTYRQAQEVYAKHPVDGWVEPKQVWKRTPTGWRRVV